MHPEIRQEGPGACPICGMALEPLEATLDQGPNEELLDMKRRLWAAVALSVPIVILDMGGHLPRPRPSAAARLAELDPAGAGDAGGAVGRLAVLRARLAVAHDAQPQHVHPDRARHRHGMGLQRRSHRGTRPVPRLVPAGWRDPGLFRAGRRHHLPGAGRPGARTARPRFDQRRHQGAARPGARAPRSRSAPTATMRSADRIDRRRRPFARAARREGAGRRRGDRRPERRRRILDHRRAHAGHQGARRQGGRRHASIAPAPS